MVEVDIEANRIITITEPLVLFEFEFENGGATDGEENQATEQAAAIAEEDPAGVVATARFWIITGGGGTAVILALALMVVLARARALALAFWWWFDCSSSSTRRVW